MTKNSLWKMLFLALVAFILILTGINSYQYLRIRTNIAPALISEISNAELSEIRSYFSSITEQLNMVKEWGGNGVLQYDKVTELNKLFFPLLENQPSISSLVLASSQGDEYFLHQGDKSWTTRQSSPIKEKNHSLHFTEWASAEQQLKVWEESSTYDPRDAPWFFSPDYEDQIHWSLIHTFMHSKELGITAAISWGTPSSSFTVFGLDIPIKRIQQFLTLRNKKRAGIIFLINNSGDFSITSDLNEPVPPLQPATTQSPDQVVNEALKVWKSEGQLSNSPVKFLKNKQRWLASFQPIDQEQLNFWLGVATPEKEFMAQINSRLFRIDILDLLIAAAGSALLSILLWKMKHMQDPPPAPPAIVRLNSYINKGEGVGVEFKSTIRTNLKTNKHGKEIELAWLKAVVAFLNSTGGALLIGVDDAGIIKGLELDGFDNKDKCLLHVKNLLNHHIGAEFSNSLKTTIVEIEEKEVLMVECNPVTSPVFLYIGKNEEFYVRSGPSSTKLSLSQTVQYVMQKTSSGTG